MRRHLLLGWLLGTSAGVSGAQPAPPLCASNAADTLELARGADSTASAYWLSATHIRWPGAPADGRYALHHAARPGIGAPIGGPVTGAESRIALPLASASDTLPSRFRFVGAGVTLSLAALPPDTRRALLTQQLVLVREDAEGRVLAATGLQLAGALDALLARDTLATDLGVTPMARGARFAVWAPTAQRAALCVDGRHGARTVPLQRDTASGIWRTSDPQSMRGDTYRYAVQVIVPGTGRVINRVTDPYSVALTAHSARSVVLSLDDPATIPAGWRGAARPAPADAPTEQVIYELHIRDFSIGDATVRPAWRGRYLAFTEPGSAGMAHLTALQRAGLTDVHLLPTYDLASVPDSGCVAPQIPRAAPDAEAQQAAVSAVRERDCFNWGYDPWHYTVPEGSYASSVTDPARRIREFRQMVMALHRRGLRVGMDVVYNHTFAAGQAEKSVLDRLVPGYYHRRSATGAIEHSTCCENTATEHAMMAKLMIESAVTWVRHYRIDAFRFDLMGHQPRSAMLALQQAVNSAAGRPIPLLGEGWNFGEVANGARFVQASQLALPGSGIATFSDRARDALRGGGCCDGGQALVTNQGLLNGLADAVPGSAAATTRARANALTRVGLAGTLASYRATASSPPASTIDYGGQPAGYAAAPGEVVNYVENHDNLTLFDVNAFRLPRGTSRMDRARAQLLGIAATLFSQGVPYLHAGIEILRSKSLDRDSFDSGDWFNRLDWQYRSNGFGAGLPPAHRNRADWPVMAPVLADTTIAPTPREIRFARDAALDLLRIRRSSTLFRLRTAAQVQERLRFPPTGADDAVIVGHLDGRGYAGAGADELLYLLNFAATPRTVTVPAPRRSPWTLHPVHRAAGAADHLAAGTLWDAGRGTITVPPRTAVVFVSAPRLRR